MKDAINFLQTDPLMALILLVIPLLLALALYYAPVAVLMTAGLLSIYAGLVFLASSSDMGILGIATAYLALGSIMSGATLLACGGSLAAILRALRRRRRDD